MGDSSRIVLHCSFRVPCRKVSFSCPSTRPTPSTSTTALARVWFYKGGTLLFLPAPSLLLRYVCLYCVLLPLPVPANRVIISRNSLPTRAARIVLFRFPRSENTPLSYCYEPTLRTSPSLPELPLSSHTPSATIARNHHQAQHTHTHRTFIGAEPIPKGGQVMDPGFLSPSVTLSPSHSQNLKVRIPSQRSTSKVRISHEVPRSVFTTQFPSQLNPFLCP